MNQPVDDKIRERAYFLWKEDTGKDRSAEDYWLQAEREILGEERSTPEEAVHKMQSETPAELTEQQKKPARARKPKAEKPESAEAQKAEPKKGPRKPATKTSPANAGPPSAKGTRKPKS